jgi:DNA-binding transcriptional LysR family regulator
MEIKGLRYFVSAATHLNFTKAAKECMITQTAMSLHISKLESELHMALFIRNNRNVILSTAGRVFLEQAEKILKDYEDAVQLAYNASLGYENYLSIGISNFPDAIQIVDATREFLRDYPNVKFDSCLSSDIHTPEGFLSSAIDAGICVPYEFLKDDDFEIVPFIRRPLRFVLQCDHPLAKLDKINPRKLPDEPLFVMAVSHLRHTAGLVHIAWQNCGINPDRLVEVKDFDNILFLVSIGCGIGLLPCYRFNDPSIKLKSVDFSSDAPYADLALVYSKLNTNPALQLFAQMFKKKNKPIPLHDLKSTPKKS